MHKAHQDGAPPAPATPPRQHAGERHEVDRAERDVRGWVRARGEGGRQRLRKSRGLGIERHGGVQRCRHEGECVCAVGGGLCRSSRHSLRGAKEAHETAADTTITTTSARDVNTPWGQRRMRKAKGGKRRMLARSPRHLVGARARPDAASAHMPRCRLDAPPGRQRQSHEANHTEKEEHRHE